MMIGQSRPKMGSNDIPNDIVGACQAAHRSCAFWSFALSFSKIRMSTHDRYVNNSYYFYKAFPVENKIKPSFFGENPERNSL